MLGCVLLALALTPALACRGEDVVLGGGRLRADAATPRAPDAATSEPDAATAEPDAATAAPAFSEPVAIAAIMESDATDDDPSLSADLTLLYFNSKRESGVGQEDIWSSRRDSATDPWQPPLQVTELNTERRETGIALAPDGLAIWWSSDRDGGEGGLDVYTAVRADRSAAWGSALRVDELSSGGDDLISAVSDSERTVLLARRPSEDDDYDLFVARRADRAAAWSEPEAIAELNSDEEESDAFLLDAGRMLLFTRDEDLQLARRDALDAPFGAAVGLDTLNSDQDDRDAWASQDFSYVVFSSDRSGSYVLYEASR